MRNVRLVLAVLLFAGLCWGGFAQEVEVYTQLGHTQGVNSVAFSPDGKQILSGSYDSTVKLWDMVSGREIRTFQEHISGVNSVAFSPDGRQVLSGSTDTTSKLWDVASGREIRTFSGHTGFVHSVAFSPDGRQILSGSSDNTIKLWDAAGGREIRTFQGHSDNVNSVTFSFDGRQVLSGSTDITSKLWDAASGREIRTFRGHIGGVDSVVFSIDGWQILSGSSDNAIKLWDAASGQEIKAFQGHTSSVYSVAFNPDGQQVLLVSGDNPVKLWDAASGREIRTFQGYTSSVWSVAFSPDGRHILLGSDNTIKLWDAVSGREIRIFQGHARQVYSVVFSPDGRQVLSGSDDQIIKLWDVASDREIRTFSGHTDGVRSVAFSPDGKQVLSGSWDMTIKLWDAASGQEIKTFLGHTHWVHSVAFSPDGKQVLSGSWDNTIKLWDTVSGREIRTFHGHTNGVRSVAFSPDGKQVLSGSEDGTIKLWDTANGREIRTFQRRSNKVASIAFSPNGRQVLSGSSDGTVRLWDTTTGKEIAQFISFVDGEWIVLTPDGYYNASPNGDNYLNVRVGNNVYGIDQYRSTFYRPQIVEARLQGRPDPARITTTVQEAASFEPPVVVIRSPENGAELPAGQTELSVSVVDRKQPIKNIRVIVNGRLVGGDAMRGINGVRGGDLEATGIRLAENRNRVDFRVTLNLDPGPNRIEVLASNPYSEGRDTVEVSYQAAAQENALPNLWILSIGINRYEDSRLQDLNYAVNDAKEIIDVFKTQEGKLYGKVNSLLIADGAAVTPIKDNIIDHFGFLKAAGLRDVVLLFIAGHGMNDDSGNFYFMPSDAAFNADGSIRPSKAVSYREIQAVLDVPGQKLTFIDACHSAGSGKTRSVDNNQLVRILQDNSTVIFTSSKGSEPSLERAEYGHGVFTYAIIQGMRGAADSSGNGTVTMKELDAYVSERVKELTDKQQQPTTFTPGGYTDFGVAEVK
jgi:WD40 repeat protein